MFESLKLNFLVEASRVWTKLRYFFYNLVNNSVSFKKNYLFSWLSELVTYARFVVKTLMRYQIKNWFKTWKILHWPTQLSNIFSGKCFRICPAPYSQKTLTSHFTTSHISRVGTTFRIFWLVLCKSWHFCKSMTMIKYIFWNPTKKFQMTKNLR